MDKVNYSPAMLNSLIEIQAAFNVGRDTIFKWIEQGAPICVDYSGINPKYSCELMDLHKWRLEQTRKKQ